MNDEVLNFVMLPEQGEIFRDKWSDERRGNEYLHSLQACSGRCMEGRRLDKDTVNTSNNQESGRERISGARDELEVVDLLEVHTEHSLRGLLEGIHKLRTPDDLVPLVRGTGIDGL